MTSSSWEDQFTCKWTQEGQLDINGFPTDVPKCLQFYLISVSRANKWARALQLIQEEEGHCFISGTGVSFPLDYESSSSEEDQPSRGPLPEDEVEFFSGNFPKDRVKKSVFLRTVAKCVVERRKMCGPLDGEDQFLNHVRKQTKPKHVIDEMLVPDEYYSSVCIETSLVIGYPPPSPTVCIGDSSEEERFLELIDMTVERFGGLSGTIGQLRQVIGIKRNFEDGLASDRHVPDMSSEEGRKFREMMDLIEDACNSFDKIADAQRQFVRRTMDFAKENIDFISDVQGDMETEDIERLVSDWNDSIRKMKECNSEITAACSRLNKVLEDLRRAQGDAASGDNPERENGHKADIVVSRSKRETVAMLCGCAAVAAATALTGSLAVPALGAASALVLGLGARKSFAHNANWKGAFALVFHELDNANANMKSVTEERKQILIGLSAYSQQLVDKSKRLIKHRKILRSHQWQTRFGRLEDESNKLMTACIDYIRKDNSVRGITGTTAMLSIE